MSQAPDWQPTGAHLVGSVPLAGTEEVLRAVANVLPDHLSRVPDGETGQLRKNWIACQIPVLEGIPQLERTRPPAGEYAGIVAFELSEGLDPDAIRMPPLGYADWARSSFEEFRWLKEQEILPEHWRFQVSLPTPLAPVIVLIGFDSRAALEPIYTEALLSEVDQICASIPHQELTIQWDVCQEVGLWEGFYEPHFEDAVQERVTEGLAALGERVPEGVELGYHLCYGDFEHEHFMQPEDATVLVEIANRISEATTRPVGYVHMPVPPDRKDDRYFRPLENLRLQRDSGLYLGLIHMTDGVEGTRERVATARKFIDDFGVATECGFGRRPPLELNDLLNIHRQVAEPLGSDRPAAAPAERRNAE